VPLQSISPNIKPHAAASIKHLLLLLLGSSTAVTAALLLLLCHLGISNFLEAGLDPCSSLLIAARGWQTAPVCQQRPSAAAQSASITSTVSKHTAVHTPAHGAPAELQWNLYIQHHQQQQLLLLN